MTRGREYLRYVTSTLAGRRFNLLILFVTSRCNAKCDFCFYWDHLNHPGDLTVEELRKISATMPPFRRLLISGGETFMRKELAEIVGLFHRQNGVATINLPTNGLLQPAIVDKTAAILTDNPGLTVNVGFSLDGLADTHDRVRGVPGCFRKAIASIKAVTALRERFPNLTVFVNSVILHENYAELPALAAYLLHEVDLDTHYFNIIRGDPMNPTQRQVPHVALAQLYREYERVQAIYVERGHARHGRGPLAASVWRAFYLGRLAIYNDIQYANYTRGARWPMPCTAGETAAVIDYNGDVRICELRQPIGNLRDYGCDFGRLWNSQIRANEVVQMRRDRCDCTHICFIDDSASYSPKVALLQPPLTYARRQRLHLLQGI
ncbi:MAG TPA: radical SAM protein [Alphaproteobacteria bacterium]|nr:radical SAM protein [Alphaproteobacteria bacterium]